MKEGIVAKRYAEGFLFYAQETLGLEKGLEELAFASRLITSAPDLAKLLENPEIADAEKSESVEKIFKDSLSEEIINFLKYLIRRNRTEEIADIAESARILFNKAKGVERATIKTAKPLHKNTVETIKDLLEKKLNKKLELEAKVDSELIGGIQAQVGNIVIDGSVRRKLQQLKEHLMEIKLS